MSWLLTRRTSARTTELVRESLVKWEQEKAEREVQRQREAALQDLVAECQDNIQTLTQPGSERTPLVHDMWAAHKGRLGFLPPSLLRDLRAAYAAVFRINSFVAAWQHQGHGKDAEVGKSSKQRLLPQLERVAAMLADPRRWPDS
jgi:hypothetical protein